MNIQVKKIENVEIENKDSKDSIIKLPEISDDRNEPCNEDVLVETSEDYQHAEEVIEEEKTVIPCKTNKLFGNITAVQNKAQPIQPVNKNNTFQYAAIGIMLVGLAAKLI